MAAGFTNAGLTQVLGVGFPPSGGGGPSVITAWYLGLINNSPSPTFATNDTMATHTGWAEASNYSGGARLAWTNGAVSGNATTNSGTVNFGITASATIYGLFLCSVSTGNATSNILACTAAFSGGTQSVVNTDTLQTTFTISAASG